MNITSKISKLLQETPLSDQVVSSELARISALEIQVSDSKVRRWRIGENEPTFTEAVWLARLFGVPIEYLTNDDVDLIDIHDIEKWRDVIRLIQALGPKQSYDILVGKAKPLREQRQLEDNSKS